MAIEFEVDELKNISIKEDLSTFRSLFKSTCSDLSISISPDVAKVCLTKAGPIVAKSLVLDLVQSLLIVPAARALRSRIADRTLSGDLAILYSRVDSDQLDLLLAIPLLAKVVNNGPDVDIWRAVIEFVAQTHLERLPTAFDKTVLDTPFRSSSASQKGIEQTHEEVDQRILEELTGRVYNDVGGFYERYFEAKTWTKDAMEIYKKSRASYADEKWRNWPQPSLQSAFFEWFMDLQDACLGGLDRRYYTSGNKVLRGSEANRKLDIFLSNIDSDPASDEHDWTKVLVIGEHKQNPDEDRSSSTLVQLAGYAREVFGSQPDRRFIPGFTICGSVLRMWVFDRSGVYSSASLEIHEEPERFIKVIAGYALMTDAELGLNTFIENDGTDRYILANATRIYLEDKPIACQRAIVCRGTTCYRGRTSKSSNWDYVVKFAWPSDKRQREGKLLKLAKQRGVTGIAEWFCHEQITIDGNTDTIATLRKGLTFASPRKLSSKASWVDGGTNSSRTSRTRSLRARSRSSMGRVVGLGISTSNTTISSSEKKRKRPDSIVDDGANAKRSRSGGSRSRVVGTRSGEQETSTTSVHSVEDADTDSLAGIQSETFGNRIHCCLVVSPAGRPLHAYRSVKELVEVFRDAVAGHRSLLEDGKILHRDVSENNIIITDSTAEGSPRGLLIDLDLAKEVDSMPSGATHRTGTMQFMAIEVLQGKGHTYRHDLESFFYVFIWICIRYGHICSNDETQATSQSKSHQRKFKSAKTTILRGWYTGTYTEIANTKRGHMVGFEDIVAEFSPQFVILIDLAEALRDVLFRNRDLAPFTGTYKDRDIMYDGMINAFNKKLRQLRM